MKRSLMALTTLLLLTGCQQSMTSYKQFGGPVKDSNALTVSQAVQEATTEGKVVTVRGKIAEVCANMGCWMTVTDGKEVVRVRFTESDACADGYYVPRNAAGHDVILVGKIMPMEISEAVARHYAEEGGKPQTEIEKIVGPQKQMTVFATGVMIGSPETLDPPIR